jgi:hypothetical protein
MKKMLSQILCALALTVVVASAHADSRPVTVVELYTSQGCSSCPPADAYLGKIANRDDIIALSFHVDYWDYIGWKDKFARPEHTQRQRKYAGHLGMGYIYTPQLVVQGMAHSAHGSEASDLVKDRAAQNVLMSPSNTSMAACRSISLMARLRTRPHGCWLLPMTPSMTP